MQTQSDDNNPELMSAILHSCRVCMATNSDMSCIFDPAHGSSVSDRITFCSGVRVTINDGLPTKICQPCLDNLQVAYNFKNLCILSDGILTKMVQDTKVKMEPKDEHSDIDDTELNVLNADDVQKIKVKAIYLEDMPKLKKKRQSCVKKKSEMDTTVTPKSAKSVTSKSTKIVNAKIKKEVNYICKECGKSYNIAAPFIKHIKKHHPSKLEIYKQLLNSAENNTKCNICDSIVAKNNIKKHIHQVHSLLKCPDCEVMLSLHRLRRHRHNVHGFKLPACGICNFVSTYPAKVIAHQRKVHMKEKSFQCDHCEMKFFAMWSLRQHAIVHNPEKKFACRYCSKKFARESTLKYHEKIHTGEKNKACTLCEARFVQKASLNYHMTKYHPEAV